MRKVRSDVSTTTEAMKGCKTTWTDPTKTVTERTKKHKPLRKVSSKQRKALDQYSKLRAEFLERPENKWCPVMLKLTGHKVQATDIHHTDKRGKNLNNTSTWLAVSRFGHDAIHGNPSLARQHGWLK